MTWAQLRMGKMEFKERLKLEVWRLEGLAAIKEREVFRGKGRVQGVVPANVKVKFPSDFLPAWIEGEMGGMGDLGVSRGREGFLGACQGRHDDEEEKREI